MDSASEEMASPYHEFCTLRETERRDWTDMSPQMSNTLTSLKIPHLAYDRGRRD